MRCSSSIPHPQPPPRSASPPSRLPPRAFSSLSTPLILFTHPPLQPGGYWINFGPLLYHWAPEPGVPAPVADQPCVELSLEALIVAAGAMGFALEQHVTVMAPFVSDPRSMHRTEYDCAFWTMRKRVDAEGS